MRAKYIIQKTRSILNSCDRGGLNLVAIIKAAMPAIAARMMTEAAVAGTPAKFVAEATSGKPPIAQMIKTALSDP
jgi:hypothetical protein